MPTLSTLILLAQWGLWACQTIMALQSDRQNAASPAPSGGPFAFLSRHQNQLVAGPPSASADSCVNAHPPPQRTAHRERGDTGKFKSQPWKQYVKVREGPPSHFCPTSLALLPHLLSSLWGPHQTLAQSQSPRALISSICLSPLCGRSIQGWHRQLSRYISDTRRNSKNGRYRKS